MSLPNFICVLICSHLNTQLTDRTDYAVELIGSAADHTLMIVNSDMILAEKLSAALTFKGHEVALFALFKITALSYLFFKHS